MHLDHPLEPKASQPPRRRPQPWLFRLGWSAALLGIPAFAALHNVDIQVTPEDRHYLQRLLPGIQLQRPSNYAGEIALIRQIQAQVIDQIPHAIIPNRFNRLIEPKDLYLLRHGECYDRSRTIEKALSAAGFEVRHINLYSTQNTHAIAALLTFRQDSHAVTEVKTSRGWLVVDSNLKWISLDRASQPVGVKAIATEFANLKHPPSPIYQSFIPVIGLYSRHGRFYPPYNPFPDVNWLELLANFSD